MRRREEGDNMEKNGRESEKDITRDGRREGKKGKREKDGGTRNVKKRREE